MGGTVFSAGGLLAGSTSITGPNSDLYVVGPDNSVQLGTPVDNSQYNDAGQDPTDNGGGLSSLSTVINDAFKAYIISQTPTTYRAAAPTSPAAIHARAQASQSNLLVIGGIVVIVVVLFLLFKK